MKTKLFIAGLLIITNALSHAATNDLTSTLQKGLFEEEANRNLDAAAQAYQTVSTQFDKDRALAATAIFRLGEIYRKQNKTNQAAAQYERIVREFADQDTLVTLSRQNLAGLREPQKAMPSQPATSVLIGSAKLESMRTELALLKAQLDAARKQTNVSRVMHLFSIPPENLGSFGGLGTQGQLQQLIAYQELRVSTVESAIAQLEGQNENNVSRSTADAELLAKLKTLSLRELRDVLPSISNDKVLPELIQQLNSAETKLGELGRDISEAHPEYQKNVAVQKLLNEKIDARVNGIMKGMELRASAASSASAPTSGENGSEAAVTDDEEKEIRRIQEIIRNSPDLINAPSGDPAMTPLCRAARNGHLRVAKFLLDGSAAIDRRSSDRTPLQYAATSGHRAMTEFLLQRGADPNARGNSGRTALHVAAENGFQAVAEALIAAKADVNPSTAKGETPLQLASGNGHAELVCFLINKGADLDTPNDFGNTPIMSAARNGHSETVAALLAAKANPNLLDKEGRTALSHAAGNGHLESVKALLVAKADPNAGNTSLPLHAAIHQKSPLVVEALLRADADPNRVASIRWQFTDNNQFYGLGTSYSALSPLFLAIKESNPELVKLLLQFKADPNAKAPDGVPLIFSVVNQTEVLKVFLDAGAKPNVTANGGTPLSAASSAAVVKLLLAAGADIENGRENRSPLLMWADWGDNKNSLEVVEALLKSGANVMAHDSMGQTPLHRAANARAPELTSLLLSNKADVNARDKNGMTPLDMVTGSREKLRQYAGSTGGSGFDDPVLNEKTAALLRQRGGQRDLPKVDRIEVRRPESAYAKAVFVQGTNHWNHFTLLDALFGNYFSGKAVSPVSVAPRYASLFPARLFPDSGTAMPSFPNLHRIVVVRQDPKSGQPTKRIEVDLVQPTGALNCDRDIPLEFGDVVEIPEREHTLQEAEVGLTVDELKQILQCREGTVELVVRGKRTPLKVWPTYGESGIGPVLERPEARQALFSSSDLSQVKVIRRDPGDGKSHEWAIDCSAGKAPYLWLRGGDVIEVPDKP